MKTFQEHLEIENDKALLALHEDMCAVPKHKLSSKVMRAAWEKKCGDKVPKKEKETAIRRAGKKAGLSRKERDKLYNENEPEIVERMMTDRQKLVQIQHYWDDLDHMASDATKKKSLQRLGYKNIKLDARGKITSFDEAKQGHALVVDGEVVARGSKSQLLKKIKKDRIKIDHKKNFLTLTGKEVGDSW